MYAACFNPRPVSRTSALHSSRRRTPSPTRTFPSPHPMTSARPASTSGRRTCTPTPRSFTTDTPPWTSSTTTVGDNSVNNKNVTQTQTRTHCFPNQNWAMMTPKMWPQSEAQLCSSSLKFLCFNQALESEKGPNVEGEFCA